MFGRKYDYTYTKHVTMTIVNVYGHISVCKNAAY